MPTLRILGDGRVVFATPGFFDARGWPNKQAAAAAQAGDGFARRGVDWQAPRSADTQVASGTYTTISGGQNNALAGTSTIVGGSVNSVTGNAGWVAK